ncbi:hypothetical protein CBM2634_U80002 [Cupriavidus taiwanensis]|uniref:Uncharacterized protein n=1 Tax=Cupriavidus taiwanensis TaxID=164546 RepID=A0A375JDN1_9BURK|nr:hypothetical protein CBM2634_U80002 [Cupriavidus taiwanensis]
MALDARRSHLASRNMPNTAQLFPLWHSVHAAIDAVPPGWGHKGSPGGRHRQDPEDDAGRSMRSGATSTE